MTGRLVVVGLGPAGAELVTDQTREAIASVPPERRWVRTTRHPSAPVAAAAHSFDHVYDAEPTFDAVYQRIAGELLAAVSSGDVLYAVPGSPRVLERTVELLVADAVESGVVVDVLPALSFLDLAWVRLGVDPFDAGVRLVDAHRFEEAAAGERGPLLIAHTHNRRVLSDVKLAFDDGWEPAGAIVLQRLGLADERITDVDWADLDRAVEPDHLTAVYVPTTTAPVAGALVRLDGLVRTLRERCPWDREQTHETLTRHLLEEAYEVLDAIASGDDGHLEEELGDLLFQVVLHAAIGRERGVFTLADVATGVHDKLHARHPHVFGDEEAATAEEVAARWEARKVAEKGRSSVFDGIPPGLPSLLYADNVLRKAATLGVLPEPDTGDDLGTQLLALVAAAREAGVEPEAALRVAADRVRRAAEVAES